MKVSGGAARSGFFDSAPVRSAAYSVQIQRTEVFLSCAKPGRWFDSARPLVAFRDRAQFKSPAWRRLESGVPQRVPHIFRRDEERCLAALRHLSPSTGVDPVRFLCAGREFGGVPGAKDAFEPTAKLPTGLQVVAPGIDECRVSGA